VNDPSERALAHPAAQPVFVPWLARLLMKVFFRQVEVLGAERVPRNAQPATRYNPISPNPKKFNFISKSYFLELSTPVLCLTVPSNDQH